MKALVVYDSWYKNTQKIAEAIADGLGGDVQVVKADNDPNLYLGDCELLVVGSPTHGGIATPATQEFLNSINGDDLEEIAVAAFDTRATYKWLKIIGFAAKKIGRQLQLKNGTLVVPPEGFYVTGKEGPLLEGEINRAKEWAVQIAKRVEEGVLA